MPCLKSLHSSGTSLEAQWLRLHASNAKVMGSIPDPATKIPHAAWSKKKKTKTFTPYGGKCMILTVKTPQFGSTLTFRVNPFESSCQGSDRKPPLSRTGEEGNVNAKVTMSELAPSVAIEGERKSWGSFSDVTVPRKWPCCPSPPQA